MTNAIEIRGVRKTFGPKVAVDHLDLVIEQGKLYGLIGPNGAGKTTTIRMVMSILFPDEGEIRVLGRASALESKDRIGYLPEERGVYRKMKVGAFLEYMARLKGVTDPNLRRRVKEWLARLDLADCYRKKCEELSKGMQQKVQFISSIIHDPDLIILDEPFSGLDPVNSRLMRGLIDDLHREGKTIIFSTHVMEHAEQVCDHIIMIHGGRKVLDEPLEGIRRRFDPRALVVEPLSGCGPGVFSRVSGVSSVLPEGSTFLVSLDEGSDGTAVMREILEAVPCSRIELRRPNLEDVFISIVSGSGGQSAEEQERLRASLREGLAGVAGAGGDA